MKLYLAGPEVFLADAREIGRRKAELCAGYGFTGLFPLDTEWHGAAPTSRAIFAANLALIREADAVLANLTPFRSISADPGTAFEVGYGFALGKIVAAYCAAPGELKHRAVAAIGATGAPATDAGIPLADGLHVEDFGLFDNLMLAEALIASGLQVVQAQQEVDDPFRDLTLFEAALAALARGRRETITGR
ncbi:nucleoside 2-deoxyribosyltransferase [Xanthobacter autotrophicus DSM 431]|uniref:nucleoside 2-deoxyribosyltransferase n=1 Tax=Xanthobacter nonsaccharivorans TaxID=3119912 RepID=UPI00372CA1A0